MKYQLFFYVSVAIFSVTQVPLTAYKSDDLALALSGELNLQNLDLSGADLRECNFTFCDLSNTNLSGANLSNARLSYATLYKTLFDKTNLTGTDFARAELFFIDLSTTNWELAKNLSYAKKLHHVCVNYIAQSIGHDVLHPNYNALPDRPIFESEQKEAEAEVTQAFPVKVFYEKTCQLCAKNYVAGEIIAAFPCGHTMCLAFNANDKKEGCVFELIAKYGKKCPLCRRPFTEYFQVSFPIADEDICRRKN